MDTAYFRLLTHAITITNQAIQRWDGGANQSTEHSVHKEAVRSFFRQFSNLRCNFDFDNGTLESFMQRKKDEVIEMLNR